MLELYEKIESGVNVALQYVILVVELIGVAVLLYAIIKAVIGLFQKQPRVRLHLAEGIALALEFKVGGELLRTVIVRNWDELLVLGSIILLRAALTFLIQWEIKIEKKNDVLPIAPDAMAWLEKVSEQKEKELKREKYQNTELGK